jgi:outer membrane autotransporter protein
MSKRITLIVGIIAASSAMASWAQASEPETHDGFFLRMGLNVGPLKSTQKLEFNGEQFGEDAKISGLTSGFDLMLGGTPVDGLVIGGALIATNSSDPTVESGGVERTANGSFIFGGIGVFANYYLDPAEGLHFQGLLGFGSLDFVNENGSSAGNDPTGTFVGLGVGYDFWVSDEWSIGPVGRVLYGSFSTEEASSKLSYSYLYPSVGIAFTLH